MNTFLEKESHFSDQIRRLLKENGKHGKVILPGARHIARRDYGPARRLFAERYFQGDEVDLWRRNIDAIVSIDRRNSWGSNNNFDASFDCLCSGYDDVLTT